MPPVADLIGAADQCAVDLDVRWQADTLNTRLVAFAAAATAIFPTNVANNAPMANWCAVISAFAPSVINFSQTGFGVSIGQNSIPQYQTAVDYVYRFCKLAYYYNLTLGLITNAQAAALTAAYNAQFP
jgi:hypothetical protein